MKKINVFCIFNVCNPFTRFTIFIVFSFILIFTPSSSRENSLAKKSTTGDFYLNHKDLNFCRLSSDYERPQQNGDFEIVYLTITIKNNSYSFNNTKNIKSIIAISKSGSTNSWFKVLTVHRGSLIPNST